MNKKTFKSAPKIDSSDKVIAGVCSGIAKELGVDPFWVRLLAVILFIFSAGMAGILYIALIFIMESPEER